jgi:uncharacterized membrane protein YedE/YeeE
MIALSVLAATESVAHADLPFPAIVFGLIGAVVFLALGIVTWSYRDVSNRHSHKRADSDGASGHH